MKKLLIVILAAVLFCGCSSTGKENPPVNSPAQESIKVSPETAEKSAEIAGQGTPAAPSPETGAKALALPGGKSLLRFEDEETGDYLDYWLIVPQNPVEEMPLLVYLHGDGNVGNPESLEDGGIATFLETAYGEQAPFVAIMPNTRQYSWTNGTVPETLMNLIEETAESCVSDWNKIIITGHSRGAIGTWYMISSYPDVFSAGVPISCGCDEPLSYEAMTSLPIWGFSGGVGRDGTHYYPAMCNIAHQINALGGDARVDIMENCDHISILEAVYTKELFEWMISR